MRLRSRVAAAGALVAALGLSAAPAEGTFPGRNGQIVFEQYREDTGEQIAIMGPSGSNPRQLTTDGGFSPAISPDGRHVVYTAFRSCGGRCGGSYLVIMGSDGSNPRALTDFVPDREDESASFSPDGGSVVFDRSIDKPGIWTIDIDGSDERRLLREGNDEVLDSPEYSPSGRKIAFERATFGPSRDRIYTMNRKGKHLVRLTGGRSHGYDSEPSWSPDGKRIAFRRICRKKCRDSEIYVMKADGSRVKPITHDRGYQEEPHWSPDGKVVAYDTSEPQDDEIAAKRPSLSAREFLISPTTPRSDEGLFDWGPRN